MRHFYTHRLATLLCLCVSLVSAAMGQGPAPGFPEPGFPNIQCFQMHAITDKDLDIAVKAGVSHVRKGIYWHGVETEKGVYDFSQWDDFVARCETKKLGILFTIVWNNPLYDTKNKRAIVTQAGWDGYAAFTKALVTRYKGKKIIYELWNEPNLQSFWRKTKAKKSNQDIMADEYTNLVKTAVPAMKAGDPNCTIVVGSISALWAKSFTWLDRCIQQGLLSVDVDGISLHPYGFQWPEMCLTKGYPEIRKRLKAAGKNDLQLINSEVGYSIPWLLKRKIPAKDAENVQAYCYVRQQLVDAMANVRLSSWYDTLGKKWGIMNNDYTPRATFHAAKTLATELKGFSLDKRIDLGSTEDYCLQFKNADGHIRLVAWTTPSLDAKPRHAKPHAVNIPLEGTAGDVTLVDTFGKRSTTAITEGKLSVEISGAPQYIIVP